MIPLCIISVQIRILFTNCLCGGQKNSVSLVLAEPSSSLYHCLCILVLARHCFMWGLAAAVVARRLPPKRFWKQKSVFIRNKQQGHIMTCGNKKKNLRETLGSLQYFGETAESFDPHQGLSDLCAAAISPGRPHGAKPRLYMKLKKNSHPVGS